MSGVIENEFVHADASATRVLIRWDRLEKRNAFSRDMLRSIESHLAAATAQHPRLPLVLTGGPYFSAGADAGEMASSPEDYREGLGELHIAIGDRIAQHPAPVIAAIEGFAFGGALVIAASCDIAVAAEDARFGLTEARVGLVGGLGVIDDLVGRLAATRLVLLGDVIGAAEALKLGLLTSLVAPGSALHEAEQVAARLADLNPDAWVQGKRILRSTHLDRRAAEADANQSLLLESAGTRARVARFRRDVA
jgi:enoyl-CoA hydratase/carnithine racemase